MTSKKVMLTFGTVQGRKSSLSLDDPKENLDSETVMTAMNTIVGANVFHRVAGDNYAAAEGAVIVETTETPLF